MTVAPRQSKYLLRIPGQAVVSSPVEPARSEYAVPLPIPRREKFGSWFISGNKPSTKHFQRGRARTLSNNRPITVQPKPLCDHIISAAVEPDVAQSAGLGLCLPARPSDAR